MDSLKRAKETLIKNKYTCVLCKGEEIFYSDKRGVKPLVDFYETKKDFSGFSAADKTIGAGAAHIYALMGIKEIWANIISEEGEIILKQNNISVSYENKVAYIINRAGNGQCPIEKCVCGIENSEEAFKRIKETISNLMR